MGKGRSGPSRWDSRHATPQTTHPHPKTTTLGTKEKSKTAPERSSPLRSGRNRGNEMGLETKGSFYPRAIMSERTWGFIGVREAKLTFEGTHGRNPIL